MPPAIAGLDQRKDDIRQWILYDRLKLDQVLDKLKHEHNVVCKKRTLERNLKTWGFSNRRRFDEAAVEAELTRIFHGPKMTDSAISHLLNQAGHAINARTVKEMRKKLGLIKRIRPHTVEADLQNTIKHVLETEYQDDAVLELQREQLYEHLRQKYPDLNIVGRDRVYKIAREMNTTLTRRYPKGHPLHRNRPYKLSGKRKAAKEAKDAAVAAAAASAAEYQEDPAVNPAYEPTPSPDHHQLPEQQSASLESSIDCTHDIARADAGSSALDHALDPNLKIVTLERENQALHQRLQQQEAEIQYMRQAYHDLMAEIGSASSLNRISI